MINELKTIALRAVTLGCTSMAATHFLRPAVSIKQSLDETNNFVDGYLIGAVLTRPVLPTWHAVPIILTSGIMFAVAKSVVVVG
jgi:hypothetical protein